MKLITPAAVALAMITLSGSALASVTFNDGVFSSANWTSTLLTNAGGASSTINQFQSLTGGNTNEYMRIDMTLVATVPGGAMFSLNSNALATYNPGTQGAITSINYSEDSINFMPASVGNIQTTGLLIMQNGKTYIQRNPVLVMPNPGFSNWANNSATGLVASDLWELTSAGTLISSSNPDFSSTGGILQFGFYRGASSGNFVGTDDRLAGIDNWHVEIVPSPGSASLLGLAGILLTTRRRR